MTGPEFSRLNFTAEAFTNTIMCRRRNIPGLSTQVPMAAIFINISGTGISIGGFNDAHRKTRQIARPHSREIESSPARWRAGSAIVGLAQWPAGSTGDIESTIRGSADQQAKPE